MDSIQRKAGIKRAKRKAPVERQLEKVFDYPCKLSWSNGSQSETTLSRAFYDGEWYKRYLGYMQSGKPYPVKIEAVAPADPDSTSSIFPEGTAQDDYSTVQAVCMKFTTELEKLTGKRGV